jgi:uncharacterized protein YbbC (DUF1343 family)/CubicO group peptidase (beta-lactamase class C family)
MIHSLRSTPASLRILSLVALAAMLMPSLLGQAATPRPQGFENIDALMQDAVAKRTIPGAVVLIGHNGKVVYRKAFGSRSLEPTREPMTLDTIFDIASLTKCVATTSAVMQLVQQGRIRLNATVASYMPEFGQNGKEDITIRELMTHYSGLAADLDLKTPWQGRATAYSMVMQSRPTNPPGTRFVYSDINYETLGFLVEKISGMTLDQYTATRVFAPLGMKQTRYLPPSSWIPLIAPTQYDENNHMLRGVVHDPTARRMGGVAGHAGLFSTADDLSIFAEELLHGTRILNRAIIEKMSTPQSPATGSALRGLGWDIDSAFSTNRGELLPVGSFGHTGFTGTSLWVDPTTDTYIILLANGVHPRGGRPVTDLRGRLATATVDALDLTVSEAEKYRLSRITGYNESIMAAHRLFARNGQIKNGIDVLEEHNFSDLLPNPSHPIRIGLVTNHTGIDAEGRRTADVIAHTPGLQLVALFSPEHGIAGKLDTTSITNSRDESTGATIYSVYGDTDAKRRPTPEALASIDAIVYDIQDIGVPFYTYESTMGYFLEAAAHANKPIYVLDRPNPIGGAYVQGPVADAGHESFVGYSRTPIRHGMTIGELARLFNAERNINARLTVITMQGWQRGDWFDSTGRVWINPSPNMRSLNEATLYPGIGMIETTNISVGRGTDTPFELIGASWINPSTLASYLNAREISGVRFIPVNFAPNDTKYANQPCGGVNILVTDRYALDAPELGIEIVSALQHLYPNDFKIANLDTLMRNKDTLTAITAGEDPRRIALDWDEALDSFKTTRAKYLLY